MTTSGRPPPRKNLGLDAKFDGPASLADYVVRAGLTHSICAGAGRLVLLSAPAGYGKTIAMAQAWQRLKAAGMPTVWLTLDRADNDVSRFLRCLAEAVTRLGLAGHDTSPLGALTRPDAVYALLLDDFEAVQEPSALALVRELVDHLPRGAHLIVGARVRPALGLARLRVRGLLTEIDADGLRFSHAEARRFFAQRGKTDDLAEPQLRQLHQKTDGWIVALWLAAMALDRAVDRAGFVDRFSGSDGSVSDYLAEQVLNHQPARVREFLLRTSLLRQLDASICQALNPHIDCAAILDYLDTERVFLTPVDGTQPAWRYHSLFADHLRARLAREMPDQVARLHLAASGWYESQGRPVPAIEHALAGGDFPHAMDLLERQIDSLLAEGRMLLLLRWFDKLPPAPLRLRPRLQVLSIWATCLSRGPEQAMDRLACCGALKSEDAFVRAHAGSIQTMLLAMQDRNDEAMQVGLEALARVPTGHHFPDATLANAVAYVTILLGQPHEARRALQAARQMDSGRSMFSRMFNDSSQGQLDLLEGRLQDATMRFRMAVDATHAGNVQHTHGNAFAGVLYASVVYEANQLDQADHLLDVYLPLAREAGLPEHMILGGVMRSRIAGLRGDLSAAQAALGEMEALGRHRHLPRVVATARLEGARVLLLQGQARQANEALQKADVPDVWAREQQQRLQVHDTLYLALAQLRWTVHFGDPAAAMPALDGEVLRARQSGRQRRLLVLWLLRALALERLGEGAQALEQVGAVVRAAHAGGYLRLILDEGPAVTALLCRLRSALVGQDVADAALTAYLQRLQQALGPLVEANPPVAPPGATAALTRKELAALQLLAEGLSTGVIAGRLFVSESAVRFHLRNINLKLGAHNRIQAVSIARRLGQLV